jgi:thiopeptide-type bacteriocin biosynthesis protein
VGNGLISNEVRSHDTINTKQFYRKTRVSYNWLTGIISKIENDIGDELYVKTTTTLLYGPEFITNMWNSNLYRVSQNRLRCTIKNNSIISAILEHAKEFVRIKDIVCSLAKQFETSEEFILGKVYFLLEKEFLLSDLRLPMNIHDQLQYVVEILQKKYINQVGMIQKCNEVLERIMDIDHYAPGTTEKKSLELLDIMKDIYDSSDCLSVDLFQRSLLTVPDQIKTDINDLCVFLMKFSSRDDYMKEFTYTLHEYYSDTYVPLIVMWKKVEDEVIKQQHKETTLRDSELILFRQILNKNTISSLDLDEVYAAEEAFDINVRPFEIGLNIFRDQNNDFYYSISDMIGYNRWGKAISKYAYELKYIGHDDYFEDDYCEVEISFIPQNHNVADITLADSFSDYVFYYGPEDNDRRTKISIDDIYLTAYGDNILFYSKKLNKRLEFVINNNINENMLPPLLKFLVNATDHYYVSVFKLIKRLEYISQQFTKFPRICYKNFILRPYCWNMRYEISNMCDFDEFIQDFRMFKDKYSIPDKVFVKDIEEEQYIRMDLTNKEQLLDLYKQFRSNDRIILQEDIACVFMPYVRDEKEEYYYSDFIFYVKPEKNAAHFPKCFIDRFLNIRDYRGLTFLPFEEKWITVKMYIDKALHEYILSNYIVPFIDSLQREMLLDKFFFIRYADPQPHIRLRLKISDNRDIGLIQKLIEFHKNLHNKDIIDKYCIDPYYREVIRYGGPKVYTFCEELFCSESKTVLYILADKKICNYFSQIEITVVSLAKLLYDMQFSIRESIILLEDFLDDTTYSSDYRKIHKQLITLINPDKDWNGLRTSKGGNSLYSILEVRKEAALVFSKKLDEHIVDLEDKREVVRSVIHVSINRFVGYDGKKERDICLFTYLTLKSLEAIGKIIN